MTTTKNIIMKLRSGLRLTMLLSIVCLTCFGPLQAATRRAIVIGLGEQIDKSWAKINGDRDVGPVAEMLRKNGFADITTLVNAQATKAAIVGAINALTARAGKGDVVYIHFSGHGQMMTDLDGDETDGLDEAWIPYDACMRYCEADRGDKHLCDDELSVLLTQLREKIGHRGTIAVVVDACHSGGSTRTVKTRRDDDMVVRGADVDFEIPGKTMPRNASHVEAWLTLSACQDFQLNQEYNGMGKLTHILVNNWPSFAGHTDDAILKAIDNAYESRKYKGPVAQNPLMTGRKGRILSTIFRK